MIKNIDLYAAHVGRIYADRYWHRRFNRSFRLTIDRRLTKGPFVIKLRGTGKNIKWRVEHD